MRNWFRPVPVVSLSGLHPLSLNMGGLVAINRGEHPAATPAILCGMHLNFQSAKREESWGAISVVIAYFVTAPALGGFLSAVWLATSASIARPIDLSTNPIMSIFTALFGWVMSILVGTLWSFLYCYTFGALAAIAAGLTHICIRRFDLPLWLDVTFISAAATGTQFVFLAKTEMKYDPVLSSVLVALVAAFFAWFFRSRERANLQTNIEHTN